MAGLVLGRLPLRVLGVAPPTVLVEVRVGPVGLQVPTAIATGAASVETPEIAGATRQTEASAVAASAAVAAVDAALRTRHRPVLARIVVPAPVPSCPGGHTPAGVVDVLHTPGAVGHAARLSLGRGLHARPRPAARTRVRVGLGAPTPVAPASCPVLASAVAF